MSKCKILLAPILMLLSSYALGGGINLGCDLDKTSEAKLLAQAPGGAKRISEHVLEVKYSGGVKRFNDVSPYNEEMDGVSYYYCGYNRELGVHLILHNDSGLFSGVLLYESTGRTQRAGHTVLFTPDRKRFLAIEQAEGKEPADWTIYDAQGNKMWSGESALLERLAENDYDSIAAEFEHPQWDKESNLTAEAGLYCVDGTKYGRAVLKQHGKDWTWALDVQCANH